MPIISSGCEGCCPAPPDTNCACCNEIATSFLATVTRTAVGIVDLDFSGSCIIQDHGPGDCVWNGTYASGVTIDDVTANVTVEMVLSMGNQENCWCDDTDTGQGLQFNVTDDVVGLAGHGLVDGCMDAPAVTCPPLSATFTFSGFYGTYRVTVA